MLHKGLRQASQRPGKVIMTTIRLRLPNSLFALSQPCSIASATGTVSFAMTVGDLDVPSRDRDGVAAGAASRRAEA